MVTLTARLNVGTQLIQVNLVALPLYNCLNRLGDLWFSIQTTLLRL